MSSVFVMAILIITVVVIVAVDVIIVVIIVVVVAVSRRLFPRFSPSILRKQKRHSYGQFTLS